MAHVVKCFRSGNTLRVSLLSGLRYKLNAQPGDYLQFEDGRHPGTILVSNLTEIARRKQEKKK